MYSTIQQIMTRDCPPFQSNRKKVGLASTHTLTNDFLIYPDESKLGFSSAKARIRILATLAQDSPISLRHVDSVHCNIRVPSSPNDTPTHRYNDALLQSTTAVPHLLSTYETKESVGSFSDALALLRIWVNQRGYCRGKGGWNVLGFEDRGPFWSGLLELMVNGNASIKGSKSRVKPVGRGLSSYQLFKATIGFLGVLDTSVSVRHSDG